MLIMYKIGGKTNAPNNSKRNSTHPSISLRTKSSLFFWSVYSDLHQNLLYLSIGVVKKSKTFSSFWLSKCNRWWLHLKNIYITQQTHCQTCFIEQSDLLVLLKYKFLSYAMNTPNTWWYKKCVGWLKWEPNWQWEVK